MHVIDVMKFEIFNRQTKEKLEESLFAVIHRVWAKDRPGTYSITVDSHGVLQKLLLIFSSGRFCVSDLIMDRIGLVVLDEPNIVFILQFSPFESDAAVAFHQHLFLRRCRTMDPISDEELVSRALLD